jgi:hypothetical protein
VAGAISPDEARRILESLGFEAVRITSKERSAEVIQGWNVAKGAENLVFAAYIEARKPTDAKKA